MIITLTMKTPDCVEDTIEETVRQNPDAERWEIREALEKWVKWDEYVTIEIDTEKGTAKVKEV